MINLVRPTSDLYPSWADAVSEFAGEHINGSGLADHTEPDVEACQALVKKERAHSDASKPLPPPLVHSNYWWIIDDRGVPVEVVGFIALRHELTDALRVIGGHIGTRYGPRAAGKESRLARSAWF
ncbi:hypothetical protein GCM10011575_28890 [Microlunatus endophyticus]|uniref:Uncharacterized protein n=1 Tax=Microlunatus endophyticus TaxID=1716077 RepID=A0A917SCH7_9ACTN|nr:hypothetical protein [Microlunatus endophyticus]GGL68463.1 hypothetical protein GCM10011575_28890 [Microlunatus endophyticus]